MLIGRIIANIANTRRRRQATRDLATLTDRELQELGISRSDLMSGVRR